MSLHSTDPKKRLFLYYNKFKFEGMDYEESFYFSIRQLHYNNRNILEEIEISVYITVENYLTLSTGYSETKASFTRPFIEDVEFAAKTYQQMLDRGL